MEAAGLSSVAAVVVGTVAWLRAPACPPCQVTCPTVTCGSLTCSGAATTSTVGSWFVLCLFFAGGAAAGYLAALLWGIPRGRSAQALSAATPRPIIRPDFPGSPGSVLSVFPADRGETTAEAGTVSTGVLAVTPSTRRRG